MKITLITDGVWPFVIGGIQKHSYYLSKYLAQNKVFIKLYFPKHTQSVQSNKFENMYTKSELEYITFYSIKHPKSYKFPGHYLFESYLFSKNVSKEYFKNNDDSNLIYIQGFSGWHLMIALKNKNIPIPCWINFHGLNMFQKTFTLKSKLISILFKPFVKKNLLLSSKIQSLGGNISKILTRIGIEKEKIFDCGIGIDPSWINLNTKKTYTEIINFVFIGRYDKIKGLDLLNHVIINLIDSGYIFKFNFIGPIPHSNRVDYPNVFYNGLIKDQKKIQTILSLSDILICPSYSEGMPTVVLEAMASGCAIIATDVGAVSELVSEKNGWLISPGSKYELMNAIIDAISFPSEKLLSLKENSIKLIKEKFLWENVINKTISEFQNIIDENEIT
jgi:glycosyltransferase involved in cell wall biosynthesis